VSFERPFWVTPHARRRFRQYFGNRPDSEIERILNVQLQRPEIPDGADMRPGRAPSLYYAILIDGEQATAVVGAPEHVDIGRVPRPADVWPVIITLYPGRKHIAIYRKRLERKRARAPKPYQRTWEEWEIETAQLMRWIGYTMQEIGSVLGRTEKQVERQVCSRRIGVVMPRWTEEELQIACDMRFAGKTYAEIAKRLGKSEQAVKVKLLRHRRWVLENPERAAFLRIMYLLRRPGKLLRVMRQTDMVARLAQLYGGEDEEAC